MPTLEELVNLGKLSVRAYNICHIGGIYTIKQLVVYYNRVGSFLKIRKCGLKTEDELISLAKQLKDIHFQNDTTLNKILVEEKPEIIVLNDGNYFKLTYHLIENTALSDNAKYVCKFNKIYTLFDLISLWSDNIEFTKRIERHNYAIRQELTDYCLKYQILIKDFDIIIDFQQIKKQLSLYFNIELKSENQILLEETNLSTLSNIKKDLIEQFTYLQINKLSERSKNSILNAIDNTSPFNSFEDLFLKDFNFMKLKNVGSNSANELSELKTKCKNFIFEIVQNDSNIELKVLYVRNKLQSNFDIGTDVLNEITEKILFCGYVPIFNIINILLQKKIIFEDLRYEIFKHCLNYTLNNEKKTLENIAQRNNLSKERIRQIKSNFEDKIREKLDFIQDLGVDFKSQYFLNNEKNIFYIKDDIVDKLNRKEDVMFSNHFYLLIYDIVLGKDYSIFGYDDLFKVNDRAFKDRQFNYSYLIKNKYFEVFDFKSFLNDAYIRKTEKITEGYRLSFKEYLTKFYFNTHNIKDVDAVKTIAQELIAIELEKSLDIDDYIVFEKNAKKQPYEYAIEILEQSGKLMHINEIYDAIIQHFQDSSIKITSLRAYFQREKDVFIFINRQSTYGLKKWEQEYDNIKGGTIRNIVEKFLIENDEPKHIYEIMQYLGEYRETNEKSVLSNLKLEEYNKFVFFEAGFVGLKSRKYHISQTQFKATSGGWFLKNRLLKFNNIPLEVVIQNLANKYSVKQVQIRNVLINKINAGELDLDENNNLIIPNS
jgi:hypothetical protein